MEFTVRESEKSPTSVWAFFDEIRDVDNLNPAEEQNLAFECRHNGKVVGMAVVDTFPSDYVVIDRIAVDESYRRCGVGTKLLTRISAEFTTLKCDVHKENTASQKMVESFGFIQESEGRYGELLKYSFSP